MATEVEILLKAIDQASAALNQVRGSSEKLGKGVSGLEKNWNSMKSNVPGLSNVLALATNPITMVTAGVGALAVVMKAGVSETVAYNKTIREMSQVTGVIPEEISRIVQAADDWGISIDSVRTALQMANKNGYQPSIEMLANMADEYVNTSDKQAFAAEAIKVFGKQYATLIPMLSQGGDELRKMTAAVNDNLIATQAEIDASREYELAVDSLGDEWTGFKQAIGNSIIPILTDLLTKMLEMKATNQSVIDIEKKVRSAMDAKTISMTDAAKITAGLRQGTLTLTDAQEQLAAANKKSFDAATRAYPEEEKFIGLYNDLKPAIKGTSDATEDLTENTYDLAIASGEAARKVSAENEAMSDMEWVVSQPLTSANEDFIQQQSDIQTEMAGVKDEIQKAIDQGYDPMGEKIGELQGNYNELSTKYDENATDHEAATARILFDFAVQKLGAEGLLTSGIYEKMAEAWGLTADAEIQAAIKADEAVNWLKNHPGDVDGMKAILEGQATSWGLTHTAAVKARDAAASYRETLAELRDKTVNVTTNYNNYYTDHRNPDVSGRHSSGADFIIPPGFDQDNYPLGFGQSGERVVVIPKNQQGNTNTVNNFNMTVHTNAGISSLMSDYNRMRAMVS